jgi:hypothetical protein
MSLNHFISRKETFTITTLVPKTGYPVDLNSVRFNSTVNNGQYVLQGTFATSSTISSNDIYFDFTLPSIPNHFDPNEIKPSIDESRIVNHSQGTETLTGGCLWSPWGVSVPSDGVVRCFLRSDKGNTSGQANFFTINLSINTLI